MGFIQEFQKLYNSTPHIHNWTRMSTNCDYGDVIVVSKNCYLCFNGSNLENCYYNYDSKQNYDCADLMFCDQCNLCYECTDCSRCYNSDYLQDCESCSDSEYCYNCKSLNSCFGCVNLSHAQYCIFNEKYTREEYKERMNEIKKWSATKIEKEFSDIKFKHPRVYMHQKQTQNCLGDYAYYSKNCYWIFDSRDCEDSLYITNCTLEKGTKDCVDCGPIANTLEQCYDCCWIGYLFDCKHIYWCDYLSECEWCVNTWDSKHCFGCVYTKNKEYNILNKSYEPAEYKKKVAECKKELADAGIKDLYGLIHYLEKPSTDKDHFQ